MRAAFIHVLASLAAACTLAGSTATAAPAATPLEAPAAKGAAPCQGGAAQAARRTISPGQRFTITGCGFGSLSGSLRIVGPRLETVRSGPFQQLASPRFMPDGSSIDVPTWQWGDRRVEAKLDYNLGGFPDQEVTVVLEARDGRELHRESARLVALRERYWLTNFEAEGLVQRLADCPGCEVVKPGDPCPRWPGTGDPTQQQRVRMVRLNWRITLPAQWELLALGARTVGNFTPTQLQPDEFEISPAMSTPARGSADRSWHVVVTTGVAYVRDAGGWRMCSEFPLGIEVRGPAGLAVDAPSGAANRSRLPGGVDSLGSAALRPAAPVSRDAWRPVVPASAPNWSAPLPINVPRTIPAPPH